MYLKHVNMSAAEVVSSGPGLHDRLPFCASRIPPNRPAPNCLDLQDFDAAAPLNVLQLPDDALHHVMGYLTLKER